MLGAHAQTAKFKVQQIIIAGDDNVQATALNDSGIIVGSVYAGISDIAAGFSLASNVVTTLPSPNALGASLNPMAIDAAGNIWGWANSEIGTNSTLPDKAAYYLSSNGTYNTNYAGVVVSPGSGESELSVLPMGMNSKGEVFYNSWQSRDYPAVPYYGTPAHYFTAPSVDQYTLIESMNNHGMIVLEGFRFFNPIYTLYVGKGKNFVQLAPPDAIDTRGGLVNDAGVVAGSFVDSNQFAHGFVYAGGKYIIFDMPDAAIAVMVTGFNDKGRVVGSYSTGAKADQHAFLYNGTSVSTFGSYGESSLVTVKINNKGAIIAMERLSSPAGDVQKYASYRVACTGQGC